MIYRAGSTDALIAETFIAQIILLDVLGNSAFASRKPNRASAASPAPIPQRTSRQMILRGHVRRCSVKREGGPVSRRE